MQAVHTLQLNNLNASSLVPADCMSGVIRLAVLNMPVETADIVRLVGKSRQ